MLVPAPPLDTVDGIPVYSGTDDYVDNYQQIAAEHTQYAAANSGANPFMYEPYWQQLDDATSALFQRYVPSGSRILDVGVAMGKSLSRMGDYEKHGIDISLDYLRIAQANGVDVRFARIEDMPYPPDTFDGVLCTDVLEHVLDLNLCVAKILAVLKPGGHLVVRVPSRENLQQYIGYKYRFVHLRILDEPMLRLVFDRVFGCQVVETAVVGDPEEVIAVVRKPDLAPVD